jgi:hypothetical protein
MRVNALPAPAIAQTGQAKVVAKFGRDSGIVSGTQSYGEYLSARVTQLTDNELEIQLYLARQLGSGSELIQGVKQGTLEFTMLKTTLVQCAWAASRKKTSYLQAQFQRLRHRCGPRTAICAVAALILTAAYHVLRDGTFYQDMGPEHFRKASPEAQATRHARQIAKFGLTCSLAPAPAAPVSV